MENVVRTFDKDYMVTFLNYGCPRYGIDQSFIDGLRNVIQKFEEEDAKKFDSFL